MEKDDLISRQAAIDAIKNADVCMAWNGEISAEDAADIAVRATKRSVVDSVEDLTPAQPVAKDTNVPCNDCISRQAAKLKVARVIWEDGDSCYDFHDKCVDCLDDVPSAQPDLSSYSDKLWRSAYERGKAEAQAEIIRCKDCKYMTEHYDTDGNVPYWTCSEWDSGTDYDGFCNYAERRTDEQTISE